MGASARRGKRTGRPISAKTKRSPTAIPSPAAAKNQGSAASGTPPSAQARNAATASPLLMPPRMKFMAARMSQNVWRSPTSGSFGSLPRSSSAASASRPGVVAGTS